MQNKTNVITSTALMVALNFVKPALGIFLLPLYLNVLTGAEYGLYTLMVAISGIANIMGTLRINSAMTTFYFDYNHEPKLLRQYLKQIFSFSILMAVVVFTIMFFIGPWLFEITFKDDSISYFPFGIIVVASGLISACNSVYYIYLKNQKHFYHFSFILLAQIILAVLIQVVLILGYGYGVYGLLLGILIPYALTTLYIMVKEKDLINFKFEGRFIKPSLKYSVALIPFLFIYWFSSTGDRIVLERFLDLEAIGQYALLMTIAGVLFLVADSIMNGIRPFLYEAFQARRDNKELYLQKLMKFYFAGNILAAGGILLIGHNLSLITSELSFIKAIPYFTFATAIVFLRSYLLLFNMQLNYTKSSKEISFYSAISLIVLLSLYLLWSEKYGLEGVLYAGLCAGIFTAILFFFLAQRRQYIPYSLMDLIVIPFICFICFFSLNYLIPENYHLRGILQFIISILAVFIILGRNIFEVWVLVKNKGISIDRE